MDKTINSVTPPQKMPLIFALAAGICWSVALAMLLLIDMRADGGLFFRMLFCFVVITSAGLTFIPVQHHMELPHLAFEGITGTTLLFYTLAFVPPPTGWLFSLPDLPVYCMMIVAVFWSSAAITLPFIYGLRQRFVKPRVERLDIFPARRQSYEVGLFASGIIMLAGLRMLTWISVLLIMLILIIAELLILSRGRNVNT